jgi:Sec-independent protein translocase protein TatA
MKLFNVGPLELILIVVLALIIFGPKRLVEVLRDFGKWLRSLSKSPLWRDVVRTSEDLRNLPNELLRETGLDQDLKEMTRAAQESIRIQELDDERSKQTPPGETPTDAEPSIIPPAPPAEAAPDDPA